MKIEDITKILYCGDNIKQILYTDNELWGNLPKFDTITVVPTLITAELKAIEKKRNHNSETLTIAPVQITAALNTP